MTWASGHLKWPTRQEPPVESHFNARRRANPSGLFPEEQMLSSRGPKSGFEFGCDDEMRPL
jgi:hypothetical protein